MSLKQAALAKAVSQVGVQENPKGSNRGKEVDEYIRRVGLDPAGKFPWCAAFVYWCFDEAADEESVVNPVMKTAGTLAHWNANKGNATKFLAKTINPADIQPGDVFIMRFSSITGHTGFVHSVDVRNRTIVTIEGNSNNTGSREGYEVVRHVRQLSSILGFMRY